MKEPRWVDTAIATLLRAGVVVSIAIVALGLVVSFARHHEYLTSRLALARLIGPAASAPMSLGAVVAGVRAGAGQAVIMAGLLLLIATPVARVAFSIVVFAVERDRLYVAITAVVLIILFISFAVGAAG